MKNIIERIVGGGAKIARYLPKAVSTRLAVAALAALAAGGAWAATVTTTGAVGDSVTVVNSTDNAGGYNWSNVSSATLTIPAKGGLTSGSSIALSSITMVSIGTSGNCSIPNAITIGSFTATVDTTTTYDGSLFGAKSGANLAVYTFAADSRPTITVGDSATMTFTFGTGSTTGVRALPTSSYADSDVLVGINGNTQYQPCMKVDGVIAALTPVYVASPSSSSNFTDLSWTLNGTATTLPSDLSACALRVNMAADATLTLNADIGTVRELSVSGSRATIAFDATKTYGVQCWNFSYLTDAVTLQNYPYSPTVDNPILPAGGVVFTGSGTLTNATVPYGSIAQSKSVTVSQNIEDAANGLQLAYNKGSFNFTGNNTIGRFVIGNQNDSVQVVNQLGGTTTVTGSEPPRSNKASVLLGHYSRTQVTFNNYAGVFSALNASSRLGWNDTSATWNVGRGSGSDTATVKVKGIKTGTDSDDGQPHTGSGTLNINSNGILELGEDGIEMARNAGKINLAGGTIKATADTQIANNKADWTILNQGKTTTLDTGNHTMTLSAPLSGAGSLAKAGSGNLIITGTGTATGNITVNDGNVFISGANSTPGTGSFNLYGDGSQLTVNPGVGNETTLGMHYIINSTSGNSTPVLNIGPGKVVWNYSGNNAGKGGTDVCQINILNGGTFELAGRDLLGWDYTSAINVAAGGKLAISTRETFTRNLNLNGGTLEISGADSGRALDLYNGQGTITATADSAINGVATESVTEPLIWIRKADARMVVNAGATLSLDAVVASANGETRNLTKSGGGTLKLMKANTCAGNLNVSGGTLDFDVGGSWAGTISPAAGTTLKFESGAAPAVASLALPANGTVTVDVSALTLGASGTTLMTFTTAPSATDVASKMTAAGAVLKLENLALKAYPVAATLTTSDNTVIPFSSVQEAVSATVNTLYTDYKYVTINVEGASVNAVDTTLKVKFGAGVTSVTVNSPLAEYASNSGVVDSETGIITYTLTPAATTYTWVATGDSAKSWSAPANWQYGASVGATRAPTAGDTVIFNNGALVTLDATTTIAGMTVNGAVSISASQKSLNLTGNVSGTGTLTLSDVCLANAKDGGVAVEPNINFTNDSELAKTSDVAGGVTVNGNVTITGTFKPWDVTHVFAGSATIVSLDTANGNGAFVFTGPVTLQSTLTVDGSRIGLGTSATVVLADVDASLADSRAEHIAAERVTTTVADSYVKATTSGSTTTYMVATQPTVSDVAFEYGDDFATATVTATVSDAAPSYKLTVGGTEYPGVVSGSTVTFSNVATGRTAAYDDVSYEIAATSGSTAVPLAGDTSGSAVVADTSAWINENSTNTRTSASGGAWATEVTYAENVATLADNTFTASNCSTGDCVTVTVENVVYSAFSDISDTSSIAVDAQGAIALAETTANETTATNFMILAKSNDAFVWTAATWAGGTPALNTDYDIVFTFNYATRKYSVTVNGQALSVNSEPSFDLCANNAEVKAVDFKGSGTISSIKGVQSTGYMVKDNAGNFYPTIQAATQAYNSANGPYTVLHSGTAPSGWKIDGNTLIKLAKGFFFMAY